MHLNKRFIKNKNSLSAIIFLLIIALSISSSLNFVNAADSHPISITYLVIPSGDPFDSLEIQVSTNPTNPGDPALTSENIEYAKYYIEKGDKTILSGNLEYKGENTFGIEDLSIKWRGSGSFAVWVEISYLGSVTDTEEEKSDINHGFERSAPIEDLLWIIILISSLVILALVIAIIVSKRGTRDAEKRQKNKLADKPIETINLNGDSILNKSSQKSKKKQKGKTQASKDLIFSVPQWEEEEFEEDEN